MQAESLLPDTMKLGDLLEIESTPERAICEYDVHEGYTVYRSPHFPRYYSGNGLSLELGGPSLTEWEVIHRTHFPPDIYKHRTFTFENRDEFEPLIAVAKVNQYRCTYEIYLHLTDAPTTVAPLSKELTLQEICCEADWEKMKHFDIEQNQDEDWYEEDDMLLEKDRVVSKAIGMRWFYLADLNGRMIAKVGTFSHSGVVSLQDVVTAKNMRRRGLATGLISAIIERYRGEGIKHFSLSADRDDDAIRIYHRLGFRDVGTIVTIMTYPSIVID